MPCPLLSLNWAIKAPKRLPRVRKEFTKFHAENIHPMGGGIGKKGCHWDYDIKPGKGKSASCIKQKFFNFHLNDSVLTHLSLMGRRASASQTEKQFNCAIREGTRIFECYNNFLSARSWWLKKISWLRSWTKRPGNWGTFADDSGWIWSDTHFNERLWSGIKKVAFRSSWNLIIVNLIKYWKLKSRSLSIFDNLIESLEIGHWIRRIYSIAFKFLFWI